MKHYVCKYVAHTIGLSSFSAREFAFKKTFQQKNPEKLRLETLKLSFLTRANCLKQQNTHRLLMKSIFSPNVELYKRWIDSTRTYIAEKSNYPAEEAEDGIEEAVNGVVE